MKVIIWCEKSQRIAKALIDMGIDATSCDIQPCEHPEWRIPHIQDDALNHLTGYDLGIGHPDCTYLANGGVRWLIERPERMPKVKEAADFFNALLNAPIPHIAIENPIQHKYARQFIRKYDEIIQPWWFGEGETKATCLWLVHLPPLMASFVHTGREGRVWKEAPSPERKTNRARTYTGIAEAMASQWSYYLKHKEVKSNAK